MKKKYTLPLLVALSMICFTGCASSAPNQPPANRSTTHPTPAPVNHDPKRGWTRVSTEVSEDGDILVIKKRCDGPNLMYVTELAYIGYGAGAAGAISVVPNSPECNK